MRVSTLVIVTLVVVLAIIEHDAYSFAYHIPSSSSRRRSLWESGSSRCMYQRSRDSLFVTAIRSSTGQEDGNDNNIENDNYYINDNEIFEAYSEWQKEYRKGKGGDGFDNIRFQNFKTNLLKLISVNTAELNNARQSGNPDPIPMTLNEYGDYSADEFTTAAIAQIDDDHDNQDQQQKQQQSAEFSLMGVEEQNRIRQIYKDWCSVNGKIYQDYRLDIFAFNLYVVENYCKETGKKVDLNKYADLSPEEYESDSSTTKTGGGSYLENLSINAQTSSSSYQYQYQYQYRDEAERDTIRQSYIEWCIANEREYIESRLDAFANNFLAVESYRKETGKNVKLSKHADLSPEKYNAMEASTPASDNMGMVKNNRNSYLESLNTPMTGYPPTTSTIAEETIYAVYQDWCQYYGKVPTEEGLYYFTGNYNALEKHYRETGEELTLNENADSPAPGTDSEYQRIQSADDDQTVLDDQKIQFLEEEQRKVEAARLIKEEKERIEQARWEYEQQIIQENERKRVEEDARLKKELIRLEDAQLEEERILVENARLLEERQQYAAAKDDVEMEKYSLREEKNRVEEALRIDRARLEEMKRLEEEARIELDKTNYQLDESLRNGELQSPTSNDDDDNAEKAETFFLPRGSYMDAVAKTWVDRSAYLESLQQGKTGVLPENPNVNQQPVEKDNQTRVKRPESLVNSIWNFMKDDKNGLATEQYSNSLIRQADKMIAVSENY
ncbi:MAG: hypothetical protein ACI90V_002110 [Bacillariaceae sp.]|jgi:hypothetical protein